MPPVSRADEKMLYNGLRRLFFDLINDYRNGHIKDIAKASREFLQSDEVDQYIRKLMDRMTRRIRIDTARAMKDQSQFTHNGRLIYEAMKHEMQGPVGRRIWEIVADNAQYIKTLPEEWASYASKYAAREALKGKRPEQIEEELRRVIPAHMAKNLKCIARTECSKAQSAITQARAEAIGCKCYFWRCVGDERTRDSHAAMDGILVFYDDPPSPEELFGGKAYGHYHAGNTFNCRCFQEVVVDTRFLPEVFSYYRAGAVHTVTRATFIKRFGNVA